MFSLSSRQYSTIIDCSFRVCWSSKVQNAFVALSQRLSSFADRANTVRVGTWDFSTIRLYKAMESLVQRLGWRSMTGSSSSNSGYCPPPGSSSLLATSDSGDEDEEPEQEEEEDRRLTSQLARLDKSYQKFSIRDRQ